ncbi:DNA-binding transcriptional LysR family regulator [Pseudomonas duriflava]|uniref:DNA-binding transcriptional LysR family regulator n=1 Tax=Pseudomonas duriflava TaxID=459528 RepID=A0A562Q9P0_9PSED|nr:LysR family transcriptional regulator [Pseudomonas duriflava]TWI53467.1 DNA-binding transcriptional LysR family regulator [Pseudomonas duriflava]
MLPSLNSIASRLRLRQLRLLIALDEHGSLHKAAELMAITQPGATKSLHEIETTLGATLFVRSSQGLQPNDLGRCVIRYARLILSDLAHLREDMLGILKGQGGRLSIGVIMGAVPLLMRAVTQLRQTQPELSIHIVEDTSARLLALLDQGRLDVAICRPSVSSQPGTYVRLAEQSESLSVVVHPDHPLTRISAHSLAELTGYRWVVYPSHMPMRITLEQAFREADLEFPPYPIETASTFMTLSLLQEDPLLLAVMPKEVAQFSEQFGMVRSLPIPLRRTEPYSLVARQNAELTAPARMLVEEVRQVMRLVEG